MGEQQDHDRDPDDREYETRGERLLGVSAWVRFTRRALAECGVAHEVVFSAEKVLLDAVRSWEMTATGSESGWPTDEALRKRGRTIRARCDDRLRAILSPGGFLQLDARRRSVIGAVRGLLDHTEALLARLIDLGVSEAQAQEIRELCRTGPKLREEGPGERAARGLELRDQVRRTLGFQHVQAWDLATVRARPERCFADEVLAGLALERAALRHAVVREEARRELALRLDALESAVRSPGMLAGEAGWSMARHERLVREVLGDDAARRRELLGEAGARLLAQQKLLIDAQSHALLSRRCCGSWRPVMCPPSGPARMWPPPAATSSGRRPQRWAPGRSLPSPTTEAASATSWPGGTLGSSTR